MNSINYETLKNTLYSVITHGYMIFNIISLSEIGFYYFMQNETKYDIKVKFEKTNIKP